jgi:hypothetical protein
VLTHAAERIRRAALAVLLCGKPVQSVINIGLTVYYWIPGVIHALFVVIAYEQTWGRGAKGVEHSRSTVIVQSAPAALPAMPQAAVNQLRQPRGIIGWFLRN